MNIKPCLFKNNFYKLKNYKIFSKNFIFIMLFIEFFKSKTVKCNFYIFKKRKHVGSFLRAPYKNKTTQFSLGLMRYFLIVNFFINTSINVYCSSKKDFLNKIKKLINSYSFFESTLVTQVYRYIKLPININLF